MIVSNKAKCLLCMEVIESKHIHDFVTCKCGNLSVDGGREYLKRSAKNVGACEDLSEFAVGFYDIVQLCEAYAAYPSATRNAINIFAKGVHKPGDVVVSNFLKLLTEFALSTNSTELLIWLNQRLYP